jgi:hypothetical protein
MGVDDGLADGEAEADSAAGARSAGIDPVEAVEDARHVLRRDADTGIRNPDSG